ncbi:inactive serine protease PAMR1 [Aplochiton taeniatus]
MLSAGRELQPGRARGGIHTLCDSGTRRPGTPNWLHFISLLFLVYLPQGTAWPHDYRYLYSQCPGPEWNVMCRGCCEYDVIRCKCPLQGTPVGYAVPCCRNALNECDPCIIHPGCSIFENCKRCNNGTWSPRDDFFVSGRYCAECRPGWSGGDCLKCGGVIHKRQGHLVLEGYPTNARCEWTLQVDRPFTIEFRFMMLSLEFDHSCRYDYVEVRDGDSINSRVIGRFCGNNRPAAIQSSGNFLHILFVSDGYKTFDGFFATFQESSACSSSPCLHDSTCVLDSSYTYHCACLAGYTGERCENVVGCRRPPVPTHGSTEGVFLHSGARVTFRCDTGFDLRGIRRAICLRDGTWSAPAPKCVPMERICPIPPKPVHGDHFLVYGPNDVLIALQYLCYRPYKMSGNPQRTCLPNSTWSGTPPTCSKVNNTLAEAEKDTGRGKDKQLGRDIKPQEEKEHRGVGGETPNAGHRNTTADGGDKHADTRPGGKAGGSTERTGGEETDAASEIPAGGSEDKVDTATTDNSLNKVDAEVDKPPKTTSEQDGRPDTEAGRDVIQEIGKTTDTTEIVVVKEKGRAEVEKKEEQVDESEGPDRIGPNDTKLKAGEQENTVELVELKPARNLTDAFDTNDIERAANTTAFKEPEKVSAPSRSNATRYTLYRAGGKDSGRPTEKTWVKKTHDGSVAKQEEEQAGGDLEKENKEDSEDERGTENQSISEKERKSCPPVPRLYHGYHQRLPALLQETVEFSCNHSYALSGDALRVCQPDGTWSGTQPLCVRACREPKVSELVRQRVLPPQTPSRKTPLHKLYSSGFGRQFQSVGPTKGPPVLSQLPHGFHHLYTHIEYECASPFYQHSGSARRTCLKTGKWSGRHVSCTPVCGKHPTFDLERPSEAHWPWLAAIYQRSNNGAGTKVDKSASLVGSLKKSVGGGGGGGREGDGAGAGAQEQASDWQLVCSGALVNQRSVVVAAHCVTELGKMYPLDAAKLRVVMGKHYRDDLRQTKGLQHLRVASISVHPNYDPLILDSDLAVIKLLDKARVGERVLPLCLPGTQGGEVASRRGLVTGWSPLPDPALGAEEQARVGTVHLADVVPCEQQYARNGVPVSVTDNMLCGRQKPDYGPSNICPADTGGILVLPVPSPAAGGNREAAEGQAASGAGLWRLLGLVSFGYDQGECDPDLFTVYTHVANFQDWLEGNMK